MQIQTPCSKKGHACFGLRNLKTSESIMKADEIGHIQIFYPIIFSQTTIQACSKYMVVYMRDT